MGFSSSGLLLQTPDSEIPLYGREDFGVVRVFRLYDQCDLETRPTMIKAQQPPTATVMEPSLYDQHQTDLSSIDY